MYDLSSKFNSFYTTHVVLPQSEQTKLHSKKDLNIQRLKDGLKEYNEENGTSYSVVETCVQGSMAMSTVVQNEDNDYDIDVGVVFDKSALGDKGAQATRNMVANALRRKTKQFNAEPEVKTSCAGLNMQMDIISILQFTGDIMTVGINLGCTNMLDRSGHNVNLKG